MRPHILSAGVILVRWINHQPHYLLLRVYNYWDFPKGIVEAGETPLMAAKRETEEETCLTKLDFCWGENYRETRPYGRGKIARYYIAECTEGDVFLPVNPELGHPEHDEFHWLEYPAARALLNYRLRPILDWANELVHH